MITSDLPINHSAEDKLNRSSFASNLAETLLRHTAPSSFTIGLYGAWGSGKTSLLNMVLECVEAGNENIVIFRFNPWLCSDEKQMIQQFFIQMSASIKLKKPKSDTIWELIDQYADLVDAANAIPVAGPALAAAGRVFTKKARVKKENKASDLQSKKNCIVNELKNNHLKMIVSIDDIDRLSEKEIIAVFQLVKSLADFPNIVYLLLFDYDVVVNALAKVQHGDGKAYLEKVVQVPFEIPAPCLDSIHRELFSKLNAILGDISENEWDRESWTELFQYGVKNYVHSIRDVIRFANVFSIKYDLLKEETATVDLLGLTCLQVFEPRVYAKLPYFRDTLCGGRDNTPYGQQQTEEEEISRVMSILVPEDGSAADAETARRILTLLFPRIHSDRPSLFGYSKNYIHRNCLIQHNIAAPECFARYFSLSLESDAIPAAEIKRTLFEADGEVLSERIGQFYQQGKIVRLLNEIAAYANGREPSAFSADRASQIILCLTRLWPTFQVDDSGFLSVPFSWRLLFCTDPLLKAINITERCTFLRGLFGDPLVQPSTLALLLQDFEIQHGRFTEKAPQGDSAIIPLDEVLALEKIFKTRALNALDSGDALRQKHGLNFFWLLGQIDAELAEKKKKVIVTDVISLIKVIGYCTSKGTMVGQEEVKFMQLNPDTLKEFIDPQEAYLRIRSFASTADFWKLVDEDQKNVVAFLLSFEGNTGRTSGETSIPEDAIEKELSRLRNERKTQ